ncbi:hypothetical protein BGZ49_000518 [Haplosporangium sp. Z 27]|nr:hypothetical protein BGZ49_000518 [Haplosporangium sp. Z 27]
MKFTTSVATVTLSAIALFATKTEAALSAGCSTYLNDLGTATNPLSQCRVYTTLGFPGITHTGDHNTTNMQSILDTYCAKPACTSAQYSQVYAGLQSNCAADMNAANQATLGTDMYMWYMSPAQRDAVCFKDTSKTDTNCVITSINQMISRGQLPDANANEDDMYGYLQYVTPLANPTGINTTAFCTPCNQQIANIFSNYYTKNPSTYSLNFAQNLTSAVLNAALVDQYKVNCGATLGLPVPANGANSTSTNGTTFTPTNTTQSGKSSGAVAGVNGILSTGGLVAIAGAVSAVLAML